MRKSAVEDFGCAITLLGPQQQIDKIQVGQVIRWFGIYRLIEILLGRRCIALLPGGAPEEVVRLRQVAIGGGVAGRATLSPFFPAPLDIALGRFRRRVVLMQRQMHECPHEQTVERVGIMLKFSRDQSLSLDITAGRSLTKSQQAATPASLPGIVGRHAREDIGNIPLKIVRETVLGQRQTGVDIIRIGLNRLPQPGSGDRLWSSASVCAPDEWPVFVRTFVYPLCSYLIGRCNTHLPGRHPRQQLSDPLTAVLQSEVLTDVTTVLQCEGGAIDIFQTLHQRETIVGIVKQEFFRIELLRPQPVVDQRHQARSHPLGD